MRGDRFSWMGGAVSGLLSEFADGRPPHAVLLAGAFGIGKRTLASHLAQTALCREENAPCGECRVCRQVAQRKYSGLLTPRMDDKEKTIKIDAVRDILRQLSRHALETGRRVVLIEDAERLVPQAQNCLLKALEEPDAQTIFLLTASGERRLLPTVRSRCRVVRMQPWPDARVKALLVERGLSQERAQTLSALCMGSPGLALKMDGDEGYWALRKLAERTFYAVQTHEDILRASAALRESKDDADGLLDILEGDLSRLLSYGAGVGDAPELPERFLSLDSAAIRRLLEQILAARAYRASYVNWQAVAEGLLLAYVEETDACKR